MVDMLRAALELAEGGWPVFPVSADSKRPRTTHGHLDATTDERTLRSWAREFSDGAVATPTGNGLLVIDIDPRSGGTLPSWAPETLTVRTQSGGLHLHYKVDEDIRSVAGLFGPGVDSKSKGGYVLVPPSPGYRWENVAPRAFVRADDLRIHFVERPRGVSDGAYRLPPEDWQRGMIHDQVVAWAAHFAATLDPDDVPTAVWALVHKARQSGVRIDNARDHIGSAIRWVQAREAANATASR